MEQKNYDFKKDMEAMTEIFHDVMLEELLKDPWWKKNISIVENDKELMIKNMKDLAEILETDVDHPDNEYFVLRSAINSMLLYRKIVSDRVQKEEEKEIKHKGM